MSKKVPKRYEKVNDNTLRIILEVQDDVTLNRLLANEKQLEERKTQLETELKQVTEILVNVNKMIEEAKKLGITPTPEIEKKK